jgi:hypothetical protein
MRTQIRRAIAVLPALALLSACTAKAPEGVPETGEPVSASAPAVFPAAPAPTVSPTPTATPAPSAAPTPTPTLAPTPTLTPPPAVTVAPAVTATPTPAPSAAPPSPYIPAWQTEAVDAPDIGATETQGDATRQEVESERAQDGQPCGDGYFDCAVFVGDSVMEGLHRYVAYHRKTERVLGDAKFLTTDRGISIADLVGDWNSGIYYSYAGVEGPIEDVLPGVGASRIFLMLGMNDLADVNPDIDNIVSRYSRLIAKLREIVPGVDIIVMTNAPKTKTEWIPKYTANREYGNALIDSFVAGLISMCRSEGIQYIDINSILKDDFGALPDEYSSDNFIHINNAGARVIVDALYDFAESQ